MPQINTKNLLNALNLVEPGLASREWIEQSTSFAFINGHVVTYNDELSIRHPVEDIDFTGAVNASEFHRLLQRIDHEHITLDVLGGELILEAGKKDKIKAGFTLHQEVLLPLDEVTGAREWKPIPEGFIKAIEVSMLSSSRDASMPALTCVHVTEDMIEGCDNIQLMRVHMVAPVPDAPFLIPGSAVREIHKYPLSQIDKTAGWVHFLTEHGTTISSRILNGRYPDTEPIIHVEGQQINFPKRIIQMLTRAQVFALERVTKPGPQYLAAHPSDADVEIRVSDGLLKVVVQTESGWFEEETIEFVHEGEPTVFSIHPALLKEICEQECSCIMSETQIKFQALNWEYVLAKKTK